MEDRSTVDRGRRALTAGLAAATVVPFTIWSRKATAAEQVVVRTPGGVFDDIKRETVYEPFRKETGIEIVPVAATGAKLLAMMKSGQNELDLIDSGDDVILQLELGNYLLPIPYEKFKFTNVADLDPVIKRKFQLGSFIYAMALAYNTKSIARGSEPKSWAEFWDIKKWPQRRTFPDMATGHPTLEFALIADGVPMDKLYPVDIDRAFRSLGRIRPTIPKFWDTGALSATMLSEGEVAMGPIWSTRAYAAKDQGAPVDVQWNQNALLVQAYGIPKGGKNPEGAARFVDFASSAETQSRWLSKYKAIPVNKRAYGATSKDLIDPSTNTPWTSSKGFVLDINWWSQNRDKVSQAWSKWIIS